MAGNTPLVEPVHCQDIFVDGIGSIEKIAGGCLRVTLFVDRTHGDGTHDREVVCRLIGPISIVPGIIQKLGAALAGQIFLAENDDIKMLN